MSPFSVEYFPQVSDKPGLLGKGIQKGNVSVFVDPRHSRVVWPDYTVWRGLSYVLRDLDPLLSFFVPLCRGTIRRLGKRIMQGIREL